MSDHITLVGNIVGDPEERATRGGDSIAAFRLAVSERRFDRERGQWIDGHTSYYAVSAFGELGRNALASIRKGERVVVSGRLRLREWENETKRGVSADVTADAVGHDLRWGTTQFQRTPRGETARSESDETPAASSDEWAAPTAPSEPVAPPPGEETAERERTAIEVADATPF
ncbi:MULTISPECIES: single-stranded DNA-binding protein [Microbacterium]|uniref:single-stranded DNA-binding protein n=1 Tax=Microbacterium TaxID=33882 RepID=UPI0027894D8C|nr:MULTISPECIES: single-stranded DNA-binding protein [Microbacterium]MDQ1076787.1 single-strand DNA-binding protein [Microbacterium sp. SORGH_AS_0969]MDQ1117023.1 single-strand DNA-binding protein [Microbacterium testaceum]